MRILLFLLLLLAQLAHPLPRARRLPAPPPPIEVEYRLPDPPRGGRDPLHGTAAPVPAPVVVPPAASDPVHAVALRVAERIQRFDWVALVWTLFFAGVAIFVGRKGLRYALRSRGLRTLRRQLPDAEALRRVPLDGSVQSAPDAAYVPRDKKPPQPLSPRTQDRCAAMYLHDLYATMASLMQVATASIHCEIDTTEGVSEETKWKAWLGCAWDHKDTLRARGHKEGAALRRLLRVWKERHGAWGTDAWTRIAVDRHGGPMRGH